MDYGQPDTLFLGKTESAAQAPNVNAFIDLLNTARFSPFMGISSMARDEMFQALRSPQFQHYNRKGGMVCRPDGFTTDKLDGTYLAGLKDIHVPETIEDEVFLTTHQAALYQSDCDAGFVGGIYKWLVTNRGTLPCGFTSVEPAINFNTELYQQDPTTNKDETVQDITKMAVTQENIDEMFQLAKTAGYGGTIENFIAALNSGESIQLPVPNIGAMNGPQGAPGRPMPNRNAGESEISDLRQMGAARQGEVNAMIKTAADPATLQKFVTEKMIPTFTKVLAELGKEYSGQDLLRQQRRVSDRLQKLMVYVGAPDRIVPSCIHDVHEMQIYKHYVAKLVVSGVRSEMEGTKAITKAMEQLDARNAAMDVARAKDLKEKADAKLVTEQRDGLRRVVGDNLAWSDIRTTVTYLRGVADKLESTYKEPQVETEMGMSYDTIVAAPEHSVVKKTETEVPVRSDIKISLDPRDPNPEATVAGIQQVIRENANRYFLNGTQVGNGDEFRHQGLVLEEKKAFDDMLRASGLGQHFASLSAEARERVTKAFTQMTSPQLSLSTPPARNPGNSLMDLLDQLERACGRKRS